MNFLYQIYNDTIANPQFLFTVIMLSIGIKAYLLSVFVPYGLYSDTIKRQWFFLLGIFICSLVGNDLIWFLKLVRSLFINSFSYSVLVFFIRISWIFFIFQYQFLALFIESLTKKEHSFNFFQKITIIISGIFSAYFIYLAFFDASLTNEYLRISTFISSKSNNNLEALLMKNTAFYIFPLFVLPNLITTFHNLKNNKLPKILKQQLLIVIKYMLGPFLLTDFIYFTHFYIKSSQIHMYGLVSFSNLLIISIICYCMRQVMNLRFLNFSNHIEGPQRFNFISNFKNMLQNLGYVVSKEQLTNFIKIFFKNSFVIPTDKITFILRSTNPAHSSSDEYHREADIEYFMTSHADDVCSFIKKSKIVMYDELAFSNFYEPNEIYTKLLQFLDKIHADIFIPLYQKQKILGYIVIEKNARKELYSKTERDEMIVVGNYIGTIAHLLQSRNLDTLIQQEKELNEELYIKQQEIKQYKESIRSFLRTTQKDIGIIFYKNRRFTFGNQAAKSLIKINLNMHEGHTLTRTFLHVARQVETYKQSVTHFIQTDNGKELVINGILNLENKSVIITVHYPEISDILKKYADYLQDPTRWDYLLYLETTQSGKIINQLIPGNGELLINFKIDLLKIALSKKASLLDVPEQDTTTMVEVIHHISLRKILETITLSAPEKKHNILIQLFGINPLFSPEIKSDPLLKKLDGNGTLFIKNIHFLDLETQTYLADFLKTGFFRRFKSEQKTASTVRFICSSDQNLSEYVTKGLFSASLFNELKKTSLSMPSLLTLPENEFYQLADGFTQQKLQLNDIQQKVDLSSKEKSRLTLVRPVSLTQLKTKIEQLLISKSKNNQFYQEIQFKPAHNVTDPELIHAAKLGKKALKDEKTMVLLWNKFKNQNKIATFLGVNRSSVNRRCKAYNLI